MLMFSGGSSGSVGGALPNYTVLQVQPARVGLNVLCTFFQCGLLHTGGGTPPSVRLHGNTAAVHCVGQEAPQHCPSLGSSRRGDCQREGSACVRAAVHNVVDDIPIITVVHWCSPGHCHASGVNILKRDLLRWACEENRYSWS